MTETNYDYERFFELSPDLLCIASSDGYFKKINPAVPALLGFSLEELYSRPILSFVHPDDQEKTRLYRAKLIENKNRYYFENRYLTKSGETVWLSWTAYPIEEDGVVFAIAKDVTSKHKLMIERADLLARLKLANDNLNQLNYAASHDLRSPLGSLMSILRMVDDKNIADPDLKEIIGVLKSTGSFLKNSVDEYIDALKKGNTHEVERNQVSFQDCLNNVLAGMKALINLSDTQFDVDFSAAEKVYFNKGYMESIFLNLITNSIKYAKPNESPQIKIQTEQRGDMVKLSFTDNGIGFNMDAVKNNLFEIHQTFHENYDSKGVGLYLIHSYVKSFGGSIAVESSLGQGTSFTISFIAEP